MTGCPIYPLYGLHIVSLEYLILVCPSSLEVWLEISSLLQLSPGWKVLGDWLLETSGSTSSSMLKKFPQSVLMYTSWEIWKGKNGLLFAHEMFLLVEVICRAIVAVKKIWLRVNLLFSCF